MVDARSPEQLRGSKGMESLSAEEIQTILVGWLELQGGWLELRDQSAFK